MEKQKKLLLVIDSNSLIHRAYHALPPLRTKKEELVNAVYGFLLVFLRAIKEFQPDYIAAAFDFPAPTFRHQKFKEYKAKRPPAPKELYSQIPKVKEVLEAFNVPVFEEKGFEADDIIGTITSKAPRKQIVPKIETIVLSGDLDSLQLVDSKTKVYALKRGVKDIVLYDEKSVNEKFHGLKPNQLLDFKALRGDPSDNIPGVTSIGEKTATDLLLEFKSLENLYKEIEGNSEKIKKIKPKIKEILLRYKEQAFLSKALAEIEKNTPIDFNLEKCCWVKYEKRRAIKALKRFEFFSLVPRLSNLGQKKNKEKKLSKKKRDEVAKENLRLC
jgi:DNA polymerase-1